MTTIRTSLDLLKRLSLAFLIVAVASTAHAARWELENGMAITPPAVTSSNILQLEIGCGDPYHIAVFAEHGPVLTKDGRGEPDYFYERGRILAVIDGSEFPLVAAGSGDAVILLSEGPAEDNYLADIDEEFIEALLNGSELLLRFDLLPENAADDSPYETYALFALVGGRELIEEALKECRH